MKVEDIPFVEELREDELEVWGGFSFAVRSEATNLSVAECVDKASLAYIQSGLGLTPSVNNNLVSAIKGNNIVVTRCGGANESVVFFAAGVDPFSTHVNRVDTIKALYP